MDDSRSDQASSAASGLSSPLSIPADHFLRLNDHVEAMPMNSINHAAGSKSMGCIPKTNNHIKTNDSHSLIKPRKEHHKSQSKDHNSVSSKPKDRNHSASSSSHKHTSSGDRRHHGEHSKDKHHSSLSSGDKHKERHRQESSSKHHKSTLELLGSNKPKDMSRVKLPEGLVESSGLLDAIVGRSDDEKRREKRHKQKLSLDQKAKEKLKVKEEPLSKKIKKEPTESDDDIPLSVRVSDDKPVKSLLGASDDEQPLLARAETTKMVTEEIKQENKRKIDNYDSERPKKRVKMEPSDVCLSPTTGAKRKKKKEGEAPQVWKWWEEDRREDGVKWKFLEHKGPVFAPDYERLPPHIEFFYDGKKLKLSKDAEEIAGFYAKMLDHEYTTRNIFNKNFFNDWRKAMAPEEKKTIVDLKKCDFTKMHAYFQEQSEKRKNLTKEEKQIIKKNNEEIQNTYGYCIMDGHKEKIGNYKIEPPGLFRGRGDHPKQGKLKKRIMPEDVIINCSKDSNIPKPPKGHKWKEVRHDKKVTWLTCWTENVQGQNKYMMLNAASKLKGEKDWQKYEVARRLYKHVDRIRAQYREDWKSKEMRIRQRAVALYFIDKLALRAGNEKEEGESADTVGCCSLRVEHIILHNQCDGKQYVVEFDFLGKDSIRYQNRVPVEKRVYKNIQLFMDNKQPGDDLFDRLNTTTLNKHLHDLMEGLTAKVFRTFNASKTLQEQLDLLTKPEDPIPAKILSYNRANRAVAILCNHQRAVPKNFTKQMENLQLKIDAKKDSIKEAKKGVKEAKSELKNFKTEKAKCQYEKKKKQLERLLEQLTKLEVQATDKDENKEIALGTSKLNYLDPRITIAWCKKWEVPIEKIYNKTQRDKFRWAIDMATGSFKF